MPFADVSPLKVPEHLTDEQVLFLSDIFPTGYMGADMCNIQPGDTIAVWGCGPVGQFAIEERVPARRGARDRHRPVPVPAADGAGEGRRRDDQLRRDERPRGAEGDDGRARAGRMHRRGRDGGARARADVRLRPREAGGDAGDGPPASRCARPSWHAATAEPCRSSAFTAGSSTSSRWASS